MEHISIYVSCGNAGSWSQGSALFSSGRCNIWVNHQICLRCAGGSLPADLEDSAYLLSDPNINQFVVKMIEDPERLKQYMTDKCVTETIEAPQSLEYLYWLPNQDGAKLNSDLTMTQCVDNFGAWDAFSR